MKMGQSDRINRNVSRRKLAEDLRALSHRILQYASRGVLRTKFQEDVSKMIMDLSGCDAVELWVKEHGKYFRCKMEHRPDQSFPFEITTLVQNEAGEMISGLNDDPGLISLCGNIVCGRVDSTRPFFTRKGSFWVGDAKKRPTLRSEAKRKSDLPGFKIRGHYPSIALIPLFVDRENVGLLQLKSKQKYFFTEDEIERYEDLGQNLGIALAHRHAQVDLRERVKELTCLYGIARLVAEPGISLEEILQGIVELLPSAWLYAEIAFARIILDDRSYLTPSFREGKNKMAAEILVSGQRRGTVEVIYGEERPGLDEGPFYKEERNLIDTVAKEVGIIIQRREAEEDQRRLQDQLRHADRLATIGQLAAGVAHELNEPLGNILGFAQLAKKCPGLPKQAEQDVEKISTASLYAREVVKKLLMFAHQMPPQKKKINLNQLVEEGLSFFESRCAKEKIEIVCSFSPDLPEVAVDPAQLNQVLVNLVVNALQAMPGGGRLTIRTLTGQDHISLMVEDTGTGMSEEILRKIFTPFFTTKDVGQGTGLGLPVVHGIVTSHGGSVKVESKVNQGTRFKIQLPVTESQNIKLGN
jgi:two-component system NtrC family sensor kinase